MYLNSRLVALVGCVALLAGAGVASADPVGELTGSFDIIVTQGGNLIAQDTVTFGNGPNQLSDIKTNDGTPESFTQIGTIGTGATPIILKVVSDGGPAEDFRVTHWYIDVPISTSNIWAPGPTSLFDPNGGSVDVTIAGLNFDNSALVTPLVIDNNTYLTSYVRDVQGHFYESVGANAYDTYGNGIYDIQVPGEQYLDGAAGAYDLDVLSTGTAVSWTWKNILNPGAGATVHDGTNGGLTPLDPGYVFELGMSMAFVAVPEPATLTLLVPGLLMVLRRRR